MTRRSVPESEITVAADFVWGVGWEGERLSPSRCPGIFGSGGCSGELQMGAVKKMMPGMPGLSWGQVQGSSPPGKRILEVWTHLHVETSVMPEVTFSVIHLLVIFAFI